MAVASCDGCEFVTGHSKTSADRHRHTILDFKSSLKESINGNRRSTWLHDDRLISGARSFAARRC
jgi:hypothetical protein